LLVCFKLLTALSNNYAKAVARISPAIGSKVPFVAIPYGVKSMAALVKLTVVPASMVN
jgi:hypothetical protein